ncbi:hypothetical protein VP01_2187g1 [Puccinia sorghi]|uniref:Major facilitator superfamily (MFS) profile domain-containing protein n=1 Tax=Puccinia sorghi TaxID=27349 RepID=A0A0L6V990_9BASI|nr:hypothetical protein VP01_2187g1 [Puccinia sorghi]
MDPATGCRFLPIIHLESKRRRMLGPTIKSLEQSFKEAGAVSVVSADVMAYNFISATSNLVFSSICFFSRAQEATKKEGTNNSNIFLQNDDVLRSATTLKNNSSSSSTAIIPETISLSDSLEQQQQSVGIDWPAWKYIAAMFMLELSIWGFGCSYGVLLDFYLHSNFQSEPGASIILPSVGTVNTGTIASLIPVITTVTNVFPKSKFPISYVGLVVFLTSIFLSSFAQNVEYSRAADVGSGVWLWRRGYLRSSSKFPILSYLPGWFVAHRGLANGIIFSGWSCWKLPLQREGCSNNRALSGGGIGGLVFSILFQVLLPMGGANKTLKYCALILTVLCGTAIYVIKPRNKELSQTQKKSGTFRAAFGDITVFKNVIFWCFLLSNTLQALASFLPALYLPNYAHSISLAPSSGVILLAETALVSGIFAKIVFGMLSDHFSPYLIGCYTCGIASLSIFGIWGGLGSTGLASLAAFAIIFGGTSGCWTTLFFARIQRLKVDEKTTMTMYGAFSMTRGIGNIISGPVSSGLMRVKLPAPPGTGFAALDNTFSGLIFFCGVIMTSATLLEGFLYCKDRSSRATSSSSLP